MKNRKLFKNLIIFLNVVLIASMPVYSATVYTTCGLYGLKNDDGNVVLSPKYQAIEELSYTPSKKIIIPMHAMDEVEVKKLNLFKIKQNNLWGVSTANGNIIHECKYKAVDVDSNGDLRFTNPNGSTEYAHPVLNTAKTVKDSFVTIIGLPVTIVGAVMIPIEAISKAGRKE